MRRAPCFIVVVTLLILGGCSSLGGLGASPKQLAEQDDQFCRKSGFMPRTYAYNECRIVRQEERDDLRLSTIQLGAEMMAKK